MNTFFAGQSQSNELDAFLGLKFHKNQTLFLLHFLGSIHTAHSVQYKLYTQSKYRHLN